MAQIDNNLLLKQKAVLLNPKSSKKNIRPVENVFYSGNEKDIVRGRALIAENQVGTLILAGGQGTRLQFDKAKGLFPILEEKTLFEIFVERSEKHPIAIMTSEENRVEVESFFKKNHNFNHPDISFFTQGSYPFLNDEGEPLYSSKNTLAMGPDGNGYALKNFFLSPIFQKWKSKGIQFVNVVLIDNPLADPIDDNLIGFHANNRSDMTFKCIGRDDPLEKLGLFVMADDKLSVIEYSEVDNDIRTDLKNYTFANISNFSVSMSFIEKSASIEMPLHAARKPFEGKPAWKFETFIFDLLPFAENPALLVYPRNLVFQPLKERGDIEKVRRALISQL